MNQVKIENIENPKEVFGDMIAILDDFQRDMIESEISTVSDGDEPNFQILDDTIGLFLGPEFEGPEELKECIFRGVTFRFSEILTDELGLVWCVVHDGPFPGFGMRKPDGEAVLYLRDVIDKYIDENEGISFQVLFEYIRGITSA